MYTIEQMGYYMRKEAGIPTFLIPALWETECKLASSTSSRITLPVSMPHLKAAYFMCRVIKDETVGQSPLQPVELPGTMHVYTDEVMGVSLYRFKEEYMDIKFHFPFYKSIAIVAIIKHAELHNTEAPVAGIINYIKQGEYTAVALDSNHEGTLIYAGVHPNFDLIKES